MFPKNFPLIVGLLSLCIVLVLAGALWRITAEGVAEYEKNRIQLDQPTNTPPVKVEQRKEYDSLLRRYDSLARKYDSLILRQKNMKFGRIRFLHT